MDAVAGTGSLETAIKNRIKLKPFFVYVCMYFIGFGINATQLQLYCSEITKKKKKLLLLLKLNLLKTVFFKNWEYCILTGNWKHHRISLNIS